MYIPKLILMAMLFLLLGPQGPAAKPVVANLALVQSRQYVQYPLLLRGEFERLTSQIDPANATSLYGAYQTGRPLLIATFRDGDSALRRDIIGHAAGLIRDLPKYSTLLRTPADEPISQTVDNVAPGLRDAYAKAVGTAPLFDGLPLPDERRFYDYRIFPLREGENVRINTGNIHQFGRYLSLLLRLAAADEALVANDGVRRDLRVINRYLTHDFLRFFWREAPAWHWAGPFPGGMRERSLARLQGGPRIAGRRFFAAFLDYDLHVMTVAADLAAANDVAGWLGSSDSDRALVRDVVAIAFRVLSERAETGQGGRNFAFDRGHWDDNPIAQYGGCQSRDLPSRPCPIRAYTMDISHAQRWPAWLESFAAAARNDAEAMFVQRLRAALAAKMADNIRTRDGQLVLPNFLDGRDGWFLTTESRGGNNAHPPSSMTGWAMRYGAFAELAAMDPAIAAAQRRFCRTIQSSAVADVKFRMANYGEPETNPANGLRPMRDEYGRDGAYGHICTMAETSITPYSEIASAP